MPLPVRSARGASSWFQIGRAHVCPFPAGGQGGGSRLRDFHRLYKESPALGRGNVAILQKLGIGRLHGGLAHLQIGGQGPLGGQLVPRGQPPGPDVLPDGQIQGFIQWLTGTFYQIVGAHITSKLPTFPWGKVARRAG